ncbi:MAG TPA: MBL fold metallo-hydrolase [Anaerolineales bacterium]|nr:MBL fold metallo-hydrolase [Anaerolineales bacterium]
MDAIANNVYTEDRFPGVTLGVISQPRGLIQIDAPPSPDDGRAWRASLMGMGNGPERVLINLDAHPDRTLGVRAMDCTVIAHEKTAQAFRNRPTTFKAQGDETGSNWEALSGLGSVRWAPPEISFVERMTIHWSETPILLESRPGPSAGAIWVHMPDEKILFIGDAVLKGQPPFLASADMPQWIEALKLLQEPDYKGYTIVSGRGGIINQQNVRSQIEILKRINDKVEKLGKKKPAVPATDKLAEQILKDFKAPAARQRQFLHRLRYGLHHYYIRHYLPASRQVLEEQ